MLIIVGDLDQQLQRDRLYREAVSLGWRQTEDHIRLLTTEGAMRMIMSTDFTVTLAFVFVHAGQHSEKTTQDIRVIEALRKKFPESRIVAVVTSPRSDIGSQSVGPDLANYAVALLPEDGSPASDVMVYFVLKVETNHAFGSD